MKHSTLHAIGLSFLALSTASFANTHAMPAAKNFQPLKTQALVCAKRFGDKATLVVLDDDNTTLTVPNPKSSRYGALGTPAWDAWQSHLLKTDPHSKDLVVKNPGQLYQLDLTFRELSNMVPTARDVVPVIDTLQQHKIPVIVLTSRSPNNAAVTERQFAASDVNLNFSRTGLIAPSTGQASIESSFMPYHCNAHTNECQMNKRLQHRYGLTQKEINAIHLGQPRPIAYQKGVLYTSGQNKGVMLQTFLHKIKQTQSIKCIVFADDQARNVSAMLKAYQLNTNDQTVQIYVYRYDGARALNEARTTAQSHKAMLAAYNKLAQTFKQVFGKPIIQPLPN